MCPWQWDNKARTTVSSLTQKTVAIKQLFVHRSPFWRHCCASHSLVIRSKDQQKIWNSATSTGAKIEKNLSLKHLKVWLLLSDMKSMKDLHRFWESYQEKHCHYALKGVETFGYSKCSLKETSWKIKSTNKQKTTKLQGWGDDSAGEALAKQAWRPVFNPQNTQRNARHGGMRWQSQH